MIKGGSAPETVFDTVRMMMERGATLDYAIAKVESILHCKLDENIKARIRQECG